LRTALVEAAVGWNEDEAFAPQGDCDDLADLMQITEFSVTANLRPTLEPKLAREGQMV
jgi:hypothetical protein